MPKLSVGQKMPDFTFVTPYETGRTLAGEAARGGKTAVVFLRYYGCTMCQYDIREFAANYDRLSAAGGRLLVVLQSDPAKLAEKIPRDALPFDIICDPEQELYRAFEIRPAACKEEMRGPNLAEKFDKVRASGLQHGEYEGEELQLPAAFVVRPDLELTYAHYARTIDDMPDVEELVSLLK